MMKITLKATVAAAAMAAAFATPAAFADGFSLTFGSGGVGFSYQSGGYCDQWGCPDDYWDMPIYDCPVFYDGEWYRGPVYYRRTFGGTYYWIHGGWRRDEWRGPRPHGVCVDRYRPALGFEFYERDSRFRIRDDWRHRWHEQHDRGGQYNGRPGDHGRDNRDHNTHDYNTRPNPFFGNGGGSHGGNQGGGHNWSGGNQNGSHSGSQGSGNQGGGHSGSHGSGQGGNTGGNQGGGHGSSGNQGGGGHQGVDNGGHHNDKGHKPD